MARVTKILLAYLVILLCHIRSKSTDISISILLELSNSEFRSDGQMSIIIAISMVTPIEKDVYNVLAVNSHLI